MTTKVALSMALSCHVLGVGGKEIVRGHVLGVGKEIVRGYRATLLIWRAIVMYVLLLNPYIGGILILSCIL